MMESYFIPQLVVLGILEIIVMTFTGLYVYNRGEYPIKERLPLIVIVIDIYFAAELVTNFFYDVTCSIYIWLGWLNYPIATYGMVFRIFYSVWKFRQQKRLIESDASKSFWEGWFTERRFYIFYFLMVIFFLPFFISFSFVIPAFYEKEIYAEDDDICREDEWIHVHTVLIILSLILLFIGAIMLRKVKENLYLKMELYTSVAALMLGVILVGIDASFTYDPDINRMVATIVISLSLMVVFSANTILPVYYAYKTKRRRGSISSSANTSAVESELTEFKLKVSDSSVSLPDKDIESPRAIKFNAYIQKEETRNKFKEFLRLEFCVENILFWEAVEDFRAAPEKELENRAHSIMQKFIGDKARTPINISGEVKTAIVRAYEREQVDRNMFDLVQHHVFVLMKTSSWPRYSHRNNFDN